MGTILQRMKIQNTICQWGQFYRGWRFKTQYVNGDNFTEDEDSKHYMSMGKILQRMKIQNTICQWGKTVFSNNDMQRTICQWRESRFQIEGWCTAPYINGGKSGSQKNDDAKHHISNGEKLFQRWWCCKAPLNSVKIVTYDMDKNNCKIHYSEVQNLWENQQHILYASKTILRKKKSLTTLKVINKWILVATCTNIHMQYTERPSYNIIINYEE